MKRFARLLFFLMAIGAASTGAQMRTLPADAERGFIRHIEGSRVSIDGRPMQLAPGAAIRGPDNLIIVPTALPSDSVLAEYLTDSDGQISRVWLLSPAEAARDKAKR
jgi:hypothetical protein